MLLANIAHDMVVSVQQPLFTELFGAEYRYSGAGVGYQFASVVCGGFTPFIATALLGVDGTWHAVAAYLAGGCLLSVIVSWRMKVGGSKPQANAARPYPHPAGSKSVI
ncbi:shikimate and dehydroshikimate transport domain protein [Collimonas arenae]|nr:shikimate and dehydroshikimate transport domain protein [Collimonas arenae]